MNVLRHKGITLLAILVLMLLCSASVWTAQAAAAGVSNLDKSNVSFPTGMMVNLSLDGSGMSVASSIYASHNADLAGLSLSAGSLNPSFSSGTLAYTASVNSTVDSVHVVPSAADSAATITVNGVAVSSGAASQTIYLSAGSTYINIAVTAEDGYTQKAYSITVARPSGSAYLSGLYISGESLDQAFNKTRTSYTSTVNTSSITVTATPEDSGATVSVEGQTVSYGYYSQNIYLYQGNNQIDIQVTSRDSSTSMTYYIDVYYSEGSSNRTVQTDAATSIGSNSATLNGRISNYYYNYDYYDNYYYNNNYYDNYYYNNVSSYGFSYSTNESSWSTVTVGNSNYSGSFNYNLRNLTPNTYYYFRAYAYRNGGHVYGSTLSFRTLAGSTSVDAPTITPSGGTYYGSQTVSIGNIVSTGDAFYTTDGTNPTNSSTARRYTSPITVSSSKVIKAAVYDDSSDLWSSVTTASFTLTSYQEPIWTPTPTPSSSFWDVPSSYWAYSTIMSLKSRGYVKGYPDSTFHPDDNISRAEITAIVTNITRTSFYDSNARHFDDVAPGAWYFVPVEKAYQQGFISVEGSIFSPNRAITREKLAEVLVNALGRQNEAQANMYEATGFNDDSRISSWARGYVVTAVKYGLITGYPGSNNFEPQSSATRAEACVMISNFLRQYL